MINDVRDTVGKQSKMMETLQTENIKLSHRVDVLELRFQLSTAELEKRLAQWDRYWSEYQPAVQRWIQRQRDEKQ